MRLLLITILLFPVIVLAQLPVTHGNVLINGSINGSVAGDIIYGGITGDVTILTRPASTMVLQMTSVGSPSWVDMGGLAFAGEITATSGTLLPNTTVVVNHATVVVKLTLPITPAVGDRVIVVGKGAGKYSLVQNAGDQILFPQVSTVAGTADTLFAQDVNNSIQLYCINTTGIWQVEAFSGHFQTFTNTEDVQGSPAKITVVSGLTLHRESQSLADDAQINIATAVSGFGEVSIGDNQEWVTFRFSNDGTVTLIANTAGVSNMDVDNRLAIFDNGSGIAVKNRLGSELQVRINISYQ